MTTMAPSRGDFLRRRALALAASGVAVRRWALLRGLGARVDDAARSAFTTLVIERSVFVTAGIRRMGALP